MKMFKNIDMLVGCIKMDTFTCGSLEEVFRLLKARELLDNVEFVTCARDKNFGCIGIVNNFLTEH